MRKFLLTLLLVLLLVNISYAKSVVLTWTAPADDKGLSTEKAVTAYKLVYSYNPITEANFALATQLTTGTPKAVGQSETYTFDLPDGKHYYFAVKSVDAAGNWSSISNIVEGDFFAPSAVMDLTRP
jgi:hypothetical protein